MSIRATEVFTPNDFPKYSYVKREHDELEQKLRDAIETPKSVISISGPSKAGKTVLVRRVVGPDCLIRVNGVQISSPGDLWDRVLDWIGLPDSFSTTTADTESNSVSSELEGQLGVPLLGHTKLKGNLGGSVGQSRTSQLTTRRYGLEQVAREIADSEFAVFLDDFHYIPKALQPEVARHIKAAAEMGVRVCLASVPHRSDDAVRSNAELRGRTTSIDMAFWSPEELAQIATLGFSTLGYNISRDNSIWFARESCGSPQIMQQICLQACFVLNIRHQRSIGAPLNFSDLDFDDQRKKDILERSSLHVDYTSLVRDMHAGPKTRGTERKLFNFIDGSRGDVYRAILLALKRDPPTSSIAYAELGKRIDAICEADVPGMGNVVTSARQLSAIARRSHSDERILEWEDNASGGVLSIVDPYLLFYIRSSSKIAELGNF